MTDDEAIAEAHQVEAQIRKLWDRMDVLLDPITRKLMLGSDDEIRALMNKLPRGFHRSELAAELARRQQAVV